ncbi:hypothetical protein RIF29_43345 [Crotalaria pallida]|uniref:NADH dehydrogenase subunit 5 C-terminal domain-containing protein n=1 Tax=Crotalaria pallida TaxID=3830 RepID=A0AAN9DXR4_CROPI
MNGWISRSPMEDLLVFADLLPASEGYRFKGLFIFIRPTKTRQACKKTRLLPRGLNVVKSLVRVSPADNLAYFELLLKLGRLAPDLLDSAMSLLALVLSSGIKENLAPERGSIKPPAVPAVSLALTPMNQIVPYVPPQPSDPLMEKISRLERADLDLSADDDVHSWLDALNERELSRLRKNFLRASVAYNVNPVADQFQRAFQTSTFCNRLYSFFNKRWFFDQVLNDFLVRSFLRFGYEVSFEALDKGAIEILGPYGISYTFRRLAERISQLQSGFVVRRVRYDPWPPAWSGGGGSSVVGKRETRLYEPEERLQSSSRGVQTGAFCSASRNASE